MNSFNDILPVAEHSFFFESLNGWAKRSIRLRTDRLAIPLPFETNKVPWYPYGRFLINDVRPASFLNYASCDYYIQDAASMLPLALLNPQPGDRVCDLCAAPGGKASAIAERLSREGCLVANETIHSRVDVLKYSLARTGVSNYAVCNYDPNRLADCMPRSMDAVLVDAPCSGQALVSKGKRDDNAFATSQIEHCVMRQRRILDAAIRMLRVGGRIIYSTCTFSKEENEDQIAWLQKQYPNSWQPILPPELEPWASKIEAGCYRLWPHRDGCAGGFAGALRLTRDLELPAVHADNSTRIPSREKPLRSKRNSSEREMLDFLRTIGTFTDIVISEAESGMLGASNGIHGFLDDFAAIDADTVPLCLKSGKHWVPSHASALIQTNQFVPLTVLELDTARANRFVSGQPLESNAGFTGPSPWVVAHWEGRPLGWLKAAGTRWNNQIPKWARLPLE